MSASIGSRVGTLPEVMADLTGPFGDRTRRGLPKSNFFAQLGGSLREIRDTWGTTKEAMVGIAPESWLEWGLGAEGGMASTVPEADLLAAHDAVTTNSTTAQHKLGKMVNQGRHAAHTALLEQLPETACPPGPDNPLGGGETKAFAKARYRSLQGVGATTCLRAWPTDSLRVVPAAAFMDTVRRFIGIEEHVAMRCPCCDTVDVDARHARICPRAGAQVNQHQPLLHAISRTLKRLGIPHQVESGEPFTADRNLRMDVSGEEIFGTLRTESTERSRSCWTSPTQTHKYRYTCGEAAPITTLLDMGCRP